MKRMSPHKPKDDIEKAIDQSLQTAHLAGMRYKNFEKELGLKMTALAEKQPR